MVDGICEVKMLHTRVYGVRGRDRQERSSKELSCLYHLHTWLLSSPWESGAVSYDFFPLSSLQLCRSLHSTGDRGLVQVLEEMMMNDERASDFVFSDHRSRCGE
jgi:hypothetical protein